MCALPKKKKKSHANRCFQFLLISLGACAVVWEGIIYLAGPRTSPRYNCSNCHIKAQRACHSDQY